MHRSTWLEERLAELDVGDIPAICAAARAFRLAGRRAGDRDTAWATLSASPQACNTPASAATACSSARE
jgi:hypothetical protein